MREQPSFSGFARLVPTAALVLGVAVIVPGRADAQILCPDNAVCLYEHDGFLGVMWYWYTHWLPVADVGPYANDTATSIQNNTDIEVCFHEHANFGGWVFCVEPRTAFGNIGDYLNDKISSLRPH